MFLGIPHNDLIVNRPTLKEIVVESSCPESHLVDREKRKTLHLGAGIAVSALLPTTVIAAGNERHEHQNDLPITTDPRINVHVSKINGSAQRAVRVDNRSGERITVSRLANNPILDNGMKYDLESLIDDDGLVLNPYQLKMFFVSPTPLA